MISRLISSWTIPLRAVYQPPWTYSKGTKVAFSGGFKVAEKELVLLLFGISLFLHFNPDFCYRTQAHEEKRCTNCCKTKQVKFRVNPPLVLRSLGEGGMRRPKGQILQILSQNLGLILLLLFFTDTGGFFILCPGIGYFFDEARANRSQKFQRLSLRGISMALFFRI